MSERTKSVVQIEIATIKSQIKKLSEAVAKTPNPLSDDKIKELAARLAALDIELKQLVHHEREAKKQREEELKVIINNEYKAEVSRNMLDQIKNNNIVQVIGDKLYYIKKDNKTLQRDLIQLDREIFQFKDKAEQNEFHALLRENNRNYNFKTFSFNEVDPDMFNLADGVRETWLVPTPFTGLLNEYKCPAAIDILLTSLSGGDMNVRNHIEECLVRKFRHPEDYKIPTQFMFGQGGVGKNEFGTELLSIIFKGCVAVTNFKTLTENATMLLGKVIVIVDETIDTRSDYDKFKAIAGNRTILMKTLYSDVYSVDNTMWLFVASQTTTGPMSITDDSTTRRFTPIFYSRDLFQWLGDYIETDFENTNEQKVEFAEIWANLKATDFTDATVAAWLGFLLAKFPVDRAVGAYHNEAYTRMVNAHKGPMEQLIDTVLLADYTRKPTTFTYEGLFEIYKALCKFYFNGRTPLGYYKFIGQLEAKMAMGAIPGWQHEDRQRFNVNGRSGNMKMILHSANFPGGTVVKFEDLSIYLSQSESGFTQSMQRWLHDDTTETTPKQKKLTNSRDFGQ